MKYLHTQHAQQHPFFICTANSTAVNQNQLLQLDYIKSKNASKTLLKKEEQKKEKAK